MSKVQYKLSLGIMTDGVGNNHKEIDKNSWIKLQIKESFLAFSVLNSSIYNDYTYGWGTLV